MRRASDGQTHTASWTLNGNTVDSLTYAYDSLGNLVSQYRVAGNQSNTETYGYDPLQRLQGTSRTGGSVSYFYSANGNLTSKSDFGGYSYAGINSRSSGCGPHATYSAGGFTYACDANGNVYGGSTLSIAYDAANHPRTASRSGAGSVTWAYDVNGGMDYENSSRGTRYFAPGGYEQVGAQGIHELGPIIVTRTSGVDTVTTTLRGRLGSTIDTIDAGFASSANARNYDAFGAARNGDMSVRPNGTLNLGDTIHGFTKHEHADDVWLIHMGGRIYDYQLGRFLNVDPIIQNPLSSQSLNPYSYIGNNPLSGTDPTGYMQCTGSHNEHDSCGGLGFSSKQVGSPSLSEARAAAQAASNGASSGQSASSTENVTSGADAGNINTDTSVRVNGNPASPGNNGASGKMLAQAAEAPEADSADSSEVDPVTGQRRQTTPQERAGQALNQYNLDQTEKEIRKIDPNYQRPQVVGPPGQTDLLGQEKADLQRITAEKLGVDPEAAANIAPGKRTFSPIDRATGFERSKDATGVPRCQYCGTPLSPRSGSPNSYEADHTTPYSRGGPSILENLTPSCRTCNRSKGAQTPDEWKDQKDQ